MGLDSMFLIIKNLIILGIVIVLANIVLRYVNRYMTKNNNIIKIIERLSTNKDSSICVVMISGEYYLMSFTKESHTILKDLDREEIEDILKEKRENLDEEFKFELGYFKNMKEKTKNYFEMGKKGE